MAIKLTSTAQSAREGGVKILVHGPAGTGKTRLCATTGEPTVIISAESGLLSLREFDIPVIEVTTIEDVEEAYRACLSPEFAHFRWVCLDSISEIAEVCLAHEKRTQKDPRKAYGELQEVMTRIIRAFRDMPGKNVYFSCKQERKEDAETGSTLYIPALPGSKLGQGIGYFFDEVFALRVNANEDGSVARWLQTGRTPSHEAKDRSGALALYEPPHLGDIARKIVGLATATPPAGAPAPAAMVSTTAEASANPAAIAA